MPLSLFWSALMTQIPEVPKVRKKWIVVWKIGCAEIPFDTRAAYFEQIKKAFPDKFWEDFFETQVAELLLPTHGKETTFEIHEIILDVNGYDKFEHVIQNKNLDAQAILGELKELLDVKK